MVRTGPRMEGTLAQEGGLTRDIAHVCARACRCKLAQGFTRHVACSKSTTVQFIFNHGNVNHCAVSRHTKAMQVQ